MLIGIDPLLHADLLHALRSMGHNDAVVVADGNFPAAALARRLLRVDGADAPRVAAAILGVLPVDAGPDPLVAMLSDAPDGRAEAVRALESSAKGRQIKLVQPSDFYDLAKTAYAIVQTGERRFYGNLWIRKGVVPPQS